MRKRGGREAEELPDEVLMERYADGDDDAFDELFRRYEPRAYVFFAKRTGFSERARDLYQELFLRVHRARDTYDPSLPFKPWFFQIARNLLIDDRRLAFRSPEVMLEDRQPVADLPRVENRIADREYLARILDTLSPTERHILVASKVGGVGYPDLARELGKSVDAVKKMASRAMLRLRGVPPAAVVAAGPRSR